jgi:hypothetical protein
MIEDYVPGLSIDINRDPPPPHRVHRVLGFFSSRPNWDPLTPLVPGGGTHSLAGEGVTGVPNSDEGTDTVVLQLYMYFVPPLPPPCR